MPSSHGPRRGRLTEITADDAGGPLTRVDNRAAVRWVLTLHRLYAPDPVLRSVRGLAGALPRVAHTTVSRWEKTRTRVPLHALRRYEELFDLPAGQLSTVVASLEGVPPRGRITESVSHLLEKCSGGDVVTAVEWADLVNGLGGSRRVLPPSHWYDLVLRLLTEMTISVGWRYLLRLSALHEVHLHPQGGPALLAAIRDFTGDPACQVIVDPVALLAGSREAAAERRLLTMVRSPRNESELRGALIAWAARRPRSETRRRQLAAIASGHLFDEGTSPLIRETAADLLATIPEDVVLPEVRRMLARGDHGYRTAIAHRVSAPAVDDPAVIRRLLRGLADAETERHEEDVLAPRLVRQALYSTDSDVRVVAVNVLHTSPFRTVIADTAAELLGDLPVSTDHVTTSALVDLLGSLGHERHRTVLEDLLREDRTDLHTAAAVSFGLAHMPGKTDVDVWRRVLSTHVGQDSTWRTDSLHRAVVYAVGMNQDRTSLEMLRTGADTSLDVVRRASWWLRLPEVITSSARR